KLRFRLSQVLAAYRTVHLEVAARFVRRGWLDADSDYFLLHLGEVGEVLADVDQGQTLRATVARRRREQQALASFDLPLLARRSELPLYLLACDDDGQPPPPDQSQPQEADASRWTGFCLSPGSADGSVVVIEQPADFQRVRRGDVLVG